MPATEILLPSQPFGNNMEFKHSAQLLAKVCLEMNKALKNGIANAVGDALAELLLKEGLSLRYQQCWVGPKLSALEVPWAPAILHYLQRLRIVGTTFFFTFPPEYFLSAIATTTTVIFLVSQPCNFHMEVTATSVSANTMQKNYLPESCPVATGITLYGDLEELERVDVSSAEIAACISHRHSLRNITEL